MLWQLKYENNGHSELAIELRPMGNQHSVDQVFAPWSSPFYSFYSPLSSPDFTIEPSEEIPLIQATGKYGNRFNQQWFSDSNLQCTVQQPSHWTKYISASDSIFPRSPWPLNCNTNPKERHGHLTHNSEKPSVPQPSTFHILGEEAYLCWFAVAVCRALASGRVDAGHCTMPLSMIVTGRRQFTLGMSRNNFDQCVFYIVVFSKETIVAAQSFSTACMSAHMWLKFDIHPGYLD